jgi:DNA polymerase sigma
MSRKAETGTAFAWDLSSPGPLSGGSSIPSPAPPQSVMTEAEHQQVPNGIPPAEGHGTLPPHVYSMLVHASHQLRGQRGSTLEAQAPGKNYSIPVGSNIPHVRPFPEPCRGPYQQSEPQQYHPTSQHHPQLGFYHENGTPTTSTRNPGSHWVRRYPNILGCVPSVPLGGTLNPQVDSSVVIHRPVSSTRAGPGYSYNRAPRTRFGDQQSDPKRRVRMQIDYLESLALDIPPLESVKLELQTKEAFRVRLTEIAQAAIARYAESRGLSMGPNAMSFKCFGSLRNGFALPDADMDLTMVTRASSFPKEIEAECPQILVKAFLDAGLGARLISRARIPIIKLCEKPSDDFLEALRMDLKFREENKLPDVASSHQGRSRLSSGNARNAAGDDTACGHGDRRDMVFPTSGEGIQCDINFAGRLAIYNSELLRCYSLCDERVRLVGLFVKKWAKARKINNPYYGTLCSYGYILMVIHYLINVVRPPVIPNLQIIYQPHPPGRSPKEVTTVDGCDVRFFNDENDIKARARANAWTENKQSLGDLLRGFFAYYGSNGRGVPLGGFDWVNSVVSIRTRGGVLTKSQKGWTTAKVDANGTRHKYLLAIEDPFEHDHNIGRTVIQSGIVAIRGEFFRAHAIINRVQDIPGVGWEWRTDRGDVGEDFFAEPENRSNFQRAQRDMRRLAQSRDSYERGLPGNNSNPSTYVVGEKTVDQASAESQLNSQPGAHPVDDMLIPLSQQRSPANVDIKPQSEQEDLPEAVASLSI